MPRVLTMCQPLTQKESEKLQPAKMRTTTGNIMRLSRMISTLQMNFLAKYQQTFLKRVTNPRRKDQFLRSILILKKHLSTSLTFWRRVRKSISSKYLNASCPNSSKSPAAHIYSAEASRVEQHDQPRNTSFLFFILANCQ